MDIPGNVQIRFIRGTAWDSKIIEYRTRAWCSHVEAMTALPGFTIGAMLKGGVAMRALSDPVYNGVQRYEIWNIPCTKLQELAFHDALYNELFKPYDWRAICAFGMGERDWEAPDSWFCSELQMSVLKKAGIWKPAGEAHIDRIDPGMAYLLITSLPGAHL